MSVKPIKRKNERPSFLNGLPDIRIEMLKNNISIRDVTERIKHDDGFYVPSSTISNILDEKLSEYVKDKIKSMCEEHKLFAN